MFLLVATLLLCMVLARSEFDDDMNIHHNHSKMTDRQIFGDCPHIPKLFTEDPVLHRATFRHGGDRFRHVETFELLSRHKRNHESTHILFTGSAITEMGYFTTFIEYLKKEEGRNLIVKNKGKGSSDTYYHLYCINYEDCTPDIIFAEIRFTVKDEPDWHPGIQSEEGLVRKLLSLRRRDGGLPLVVYVYMGHIHDTCDYPQEPEFNDFAGHYGFTTIDICLVTKHCFGRHNYSKWGMYSADVVHPTPDISRQFLTDILKEWWKSAPRWYERNSKFLRPRTEHMLAKQTLPDRLYPVNAISNRTHCKVVGGKGIDSLKPLTTKGFKIVKRVKIGEMGFNNIKRCWQGDTVGDYITFAFYGSRVQVTVYQGQGAFGIMAVYIDGEPKPRKTVTSYFEGFYWAKGNGRQLIIPLFDDLTSDNHTVTFKITDQPANPENPGHTCQIIALLY